MLIGSVAQQNISILAYTSAEIAHSVLIWHTSFTQTAHQSFCVVLVGPIKKFYLSSMVILIRTYHCKNKLVVLTTEWFAWLQTNWSNSGHESFTLGNCMHKATQTAASQFILQPQYTENSYNILDSLIWLHINSILQLWSAFVINPSQMLWWLSVYCVCKMNWAVAYWVTLCK